MKTWYTIILFAFGVFVIGGLAYLLYYVFPEVFKGDQTVMVASTILLIAVASALFLFGVFLGYFYGKPDEKWEINKRKFENLRAALDFERKDRKRIEEELEQSKRAVVRLEDRLNKDNKSADRELDQESTEVVRQLKMDNLALAQQYESVCQNLMQRKDRIADLLADLSVAQEDAEKARHELKQIKKEAPSQHKDIMSLFPEAASLKEMLEGVLELEGIRMVLIADDYGLLVESAGKGFPSETLAALSSLVARIGPQIQDFFSMGNVTTVVLGDDKGLVLETSYFELFDVRCALTIARDKSFQYPDLSEQTVTAIIGRFKD